jgi:hypothetical protein
MPERPSLDSTEPIHVTELGLGRELEFQPRFGARIVA